MNHLLTLLFSFASIFSIAQMDVVIPPEYDQLTILENDYIIAQNGIDYGLLDVNNNTILPVEYAQIQQITDSIFAVWDYFASVHIVHLNGLPHLQTYNEFRSVGPDTNSILLKNHEYKWGVLDRNYNIKIPFEYHSIKSVFEDGTYIFSKKDKNYGANNPDGTRILADTFQFLSRENNYFFGGIIDSFFIYDLTGKRMTTTAFQKIYSNIENSAMIAQNKDGNWMLLDKNINVISDSFKYYQFYQGDSLFIVRENNGSAGIYNIKNEKWIYHTKNYLLISLCPGYLQFQTSEKRGLMNENGEILIELREAVNYEAHGSTIYLDSRDGVGVYNIATSQLVMYPNAYRINFDEDYYVVFSDNGDSKLSVYDFSGNSIIKDVFGYASNCEIRGRYLVFQSESGKCGLGRLR